MRVEEERGTVVGFGVVVEDEEPVGVLQKT